MRLGMRCIFLFCRWLYIDKKMRLLYYYYNREVARIKILQAKVHGDHMVLKIDFNSEEAIYVQLRNQIIVGIATAQIAEGQSLPSVRALAENIGINMHTVNKAYAVLRQDGFVKLDRRKGAYIALDYDKCIAERELAKNLQIVLAEAICKHISREEVHCIVDQIFDFYERR